MSERIRKVKGDIELDRFHVKDAEKLLAFNLTKKRIVDLCNRGFEEDPFDQAKNYSTWHRALDGHEVWNGIVLELEGLYGMQEKHPRRYLPDDPPEENLHLWMKSLASADWWLATLEPEASPSAFRAWFSNRPLGKKKVEDVRERVNDWWARLIAEVDLAERYTAAQARNRESWSDHEEPKVLTWDTYCRDLLDDGLSVEEVRQRYIDERMLVERYRVNLLDLAAPVALSQGREDGCEYLSSEQKDIESSWTSLVDAGFPKAVSRTPPDFDPEPYFTENQWGDRRHERCPKELNQELYNRWYRSRCLRYWDAEERCVKTESEIVQVSEDGKTWHEANAREKQGWDSGEYFWLEAMELGNGDTRNPYQRDRDELLEERRKWRKEYEYSVDGSDYETKAKRNLEAVERKLATLHLVIE